MINKNMFVKPKIALEGQKTRLIISNHPRINLRHVRPASMLSLHMN